MEGGKLLFRTKQAEVSPAKGHYHTYSGKHRYDRANREFGHYLHTKLICNLVFWRFTGNRCNFCFDFVLGVVFQEASFNMVRADNRVANVRTIDLRRSISRD